MVASVVKKVEYNCESRIFTLQSTVEAVLLHFGIIVQVAKGQLCSLIIECLHHAEKEYCIKWVTGDFQLGNWLEDRGVRIFTARFDS